MISATLETLLCLLFIICVAWLYSTITEFLLNNASVAVSDGVDSPPVNDVAILAENETPQRTQSHQDDCHTCAGTCRASHMKWAKGRALDYLPHDPQNAVASFISDMGKHPKTQDLALIAIPMAQLALVDTPEGLKRMIEGFNEHSCDCSRGDAQ